MEKIIQNTLASSWSTDDKQLLFQITIVFYNGVAYPEISVNVFFIDLPTDNKILCWENTNLPFFKPLPVEYVVLSKQYHISGYITCKLEKHVTHTDLIIWADIKYGIYPYNEFIGTIYYQKLPHDAPLPPIPPPRPDDDYPVISGQPYHDLFPFTYMHNWPEPGEAEIAINFIVYVPYSSSPPQSDFYTTLCTLKAAGDRQGMEAAAVDFIENSSSFVKSIQLLPSPVNCFNDSVIITIKNNTYAEFVAIVCIEASISKEELAEYLTTTGYYETKECLWLSYFALVILPGYRSRLLNDITRTLQACHALEALLLQASPPVDTANPVLTKMLLHASIILPQDAFPVPFSVSPDANNTIAPYAIGDLQLVRQKLIRYEPGEIANIINVMPGEKKSIERRKLNQYSQKITESSENNNETLDFEEENEQDFEKEISRTLADYTKQYNYDNLQNTYGAPTNITINGTYTETRTGQKPELKEISTFAKQILNSTTRKLSEKIYRARQQNTKNEYEESETCKFENKSETQSLQGIYYWLNKIYLAEVINYGNRFITGLTIASPAQKYIAQSYNLAGSNLQEPIAPAEQGILTFNDITPQNYAALCSYYKVNDITPPPPASITVSESLAGNENKLIEIPKGYYASTASLTYVLSQDAGATVQCLLGKNQLSIDHPQSGTESLTMNNENTTVPFSAFYSYPITSPPYTPPSFIINAEVTCLLGDERLTEWKISLYQKITDGYEKMRREYYSNFNTKNPETETANPSKNRLTVRNELKKQCVLLLLEYAGLNLQNNKNNASPPLDMPACARYEQFFNQAFEWNEMTYTFIENYTDNAKASTAIFSSGDNFFTAFLQAQEAQIFLPAKPAFNYRIIFFMATGAIWTAEDKLAPLLYTQTSLVSELKRVFNQPQPIQTEKILDFWEIIVPTSLQILNKKFNPQIQ